MSVSSPIVFPNVGLQVLACLLYFFGLTSITYCLSRRIATEDFTSWQGLSQITWPRALVLLVFLDSWLFLISSGLLIFGVGLEYSQGVCAAGIYLCIGCYATSKLLIYAFLIEKVHVVWSPTPGVPRFKSRVYMICAITVALYLIIITLLVIGRIHYFRSGDNACVIGLKPLSAIPLLSYDLYVNVFLTTLFLWPLFRPKVVTASVKRVAIRTLIASAVALTTSTVNIITLAILKGTELGWICLGSCATDVVINALAIFWVTRGLDSDKITDSPMVVSRGLLGNERRHTAAVPMGDVVERQLSPGKVARSRTYGYFLETANQTRSASEPSSGQHKIPKRIKSMVDLFRSKEKSVEHPSLQITVTTEYEIEEPSDSWQSNKSKTKPSK